MVDLSPPLQLQYLLLLGGERFADGRLADLVNTVLRQSALDRRLADDHGLADILNILPLLPDHAHYFQLQTGIEYSSFSCCHV